MRPWKFFVPLLASSLCFAAQPDRIAGPINSSQMVALAKSVHPTAKAQYDQGPVDPALNLSYITMLMAPSASQQSGLELLLEQQQDRRSPNYHKWLTPQQFGDQFGLSQSDMDKITNWLKSQGFQILSAGGARNSIVFSGTAAQAQSAFRTEIHNYEVAGTQHFANSTPLMIPAALNGIVGSVMGLHSFFPKPASQLRGGARNPHGAYYDSGFVFPNFLAPDDIATIYDIAPLYSASPAVNGSGEKLGIIGQTDIYLADINYFREGFNLNQITGCTSSTTSGVVTACNSTYFQYVLVGTDPGAPSTCGDLSEADLDIEWSGAVARDAQIVYFNSPVTYKDNCTELASGGGVNAALNAAINPSSGSPLATVLSMSYGECEDGADNLETVLKQGNAEGITIVNSAGDQGAASCDYSPPGNAANPPYSPAEYGLAVSYPASSPEVTGVGGTSITLANDSYPSPATAYWSTSPGPNDGTALQYVPEQPWNDDEELAAYCQAPAAGDPFCKQGGSAAQKGWIPLTTSATAAQVQTDIWISAGGGGASNCFYVTSSDVCLGAGAGPTGGGFAQPSYQQHLVVPGAPTGVRYVPDVSMLASPDFPGYIFCTPESEVEDTSSTTSSCAGGIANALNNGAYVSAIGGTSVSTPVFAGIIALLDQSLGGSGQGNINATLYALAVTPIKGVFHPITTGDNKVSCSPNTPTGFPANVMCTSSGVIGFSASNADPTTGYNLVNGLGSVDANKLIESLDAPDFQLTIGAFSPSSIPAGQSASATVTLTAIAGSTGMVVNFGPSSCSGLPVGATCTFNPIAVNFDGTNPATTEVTISTLANMTAPVSPSITITPTNSPNTTTALAGFAVAKTNQSFTITPTSGAATYSIAAGGKESINITVTGSGSPAAFSPATLPLTFTCAQSSLPLETQCSFSPTIGQAVAQNTLTLTLTTTPPTSELRHPRGRGNGIFYALLLPGIFGIVIAAGSRKSGVRLLGLIVVLGFSTMWLGSCGGGGGSNSSQNNPGTPAGTYAIVVNATTGGATPLTGSFTVNLTVTQ
jgi:subtilase family serine protease